MRKSTSFTEQEILILKMNPHTAKVSDTRVLLTLDAKQKILERYNKRNMCVIDLHSPAKEQSVPFPITLFATLSALPFTDKTSMQMTSDYMEVKYRLMWTSEEHL